MSGWFNNKQKIRFKNTLSRDMLSPEKLKMKGRKKMQQASVKQKKAREMVLTSAESKCQAKNSREEYYIQVKRT